MWPCADRHARKDAAAPRAARPGPPSFAAAPSRHQQVRAAGLHPDYWYPVEYDDRVRGGQVVEVRFWGQSIALYRGADGRMRALENRCAHRQLPLSLGAVTGCELTGAYHGWRYGEDVYEYPYHRARFQWSNIDGDIAYWTFLLPAGPHTTRVFFVFCYDRLAPRMVPLRLGHGVLRTLLRLIGPSLRRLLGQDRFALEAEQAGWDRHFEQPIPDLNPVVPLVERLTIDKWKKHLGAAATSAPPQPAARR